VLQSNYFARRQALKLTTPIISKVTPRIITLLIVVAGQPSCPPKHHYLQAKLVGSVAVVLPDSSGPDRTDPAGPLEVPALEVGAVKPLWPARLQPAPQPPPPAAAYRQCSVAASTSQSHTRRHSPPECEPLPLGLQSSTGGRLSLTLTGISWRVACHSPAASE
jgi:hypothetical protein